MRLQRLSDGESVHLDPASRLSAGSFGRVFVVLGNRTLAAKVYHKSSEADGRKLTAMIARAPVGLQSGPVHCSVAWPTDLLAAVDDDCRIVGFLMPRVMGMRPITDFSDPVSRCRHCPQFGYRSLLRTARNLAATFSALHAQGLVVGGIDDADILVSESSQVTLVGTDSFQVRDPGSEELYPCSAGKPQYRPPELQEAGSPFLERSPAQDRFGLAVLLFELLMEGTHPFDGVSVSRGDALTVEARIAAGHFPYAEASDGLHQPVPHAPPFQTLNPALRDLFIRCFVEGHVDPAVRPDAREWQVALAEAEQALVPCSTDRQHFYGNHLVGCPWCRREALSGPGPTLPTGTVHPRPPTPVPVPPGAPAAATAGRPRSAGIVPPTPILQTAPRYRRGRSAMSPPDSLPARTEPINLWAWLALIFALLALAPKCYLWAGAAACVCGIVGWFHGRAPGGRERWLRTTALGVALAVVVGVPLSRRVLPQGMIRRVAERSGWMRLRQGLTPSWRLELERRQIRAHFGTRPPNRTVPGSPHLVWQSQQPGEARRSHRTEPRRAGTGRQAVISHVAPIRSRRMQKAPPSLRRGSEPMAHSVADPEEAARDRLRQERLRELDEDLVRHNQERARRLRELDEDLAAREKQRQARLRELSQETPVR